MKTKIDDLLTDWNFRFFLRLCLQLIIILLSAFARRVKYKEAVQICGLGIAAPRQAIW